jgi:hypothetical protein
MVHLGVNPMHARLFSAALAWCCLLGLLVPQGATTARDPLFVAEKKVAPADQEATNLKQIGIAIHSYHDVYNQFPRALCDARGKPLLSWRVAVLPYIEQQDLFKQFKLEEPWDSAHNKKLLAKMPTIYAPLRSEEPEPGHGTQTPYQLFVGEGTALPTLSSKARLLQITDGTSNTMLLGESSRLVPWTKPDEMEVTAKALPKIGGHFRGFTQVLLWDGSVHKIKRDLDEKTLRPFLTSRGGETVDITKLKP